MADYAGACAAAKTKFKNEWVNGENPLTPVQYVNEQNITDLTDGQGNALPWASFEIISAGSAQIGFGTPSNKPIAYDGLIKVRVFTPRDEGIGDGMALALRAGEMFRNQQFYDDVTPGCYVRSGFDLRGQPRITEGDTLSEDGNWFSITAVIPFTYFHRA